MFLFFIFIHRYDLFDNTLARITSEFVETFRRNRLALAFVSSFRLLDERQLARILSRPFAVPPRRRPRPAGFADSCTFLEIQVALNCRARIVLAACRALIRRRLRVCGTRALISHSTHMPAVRRNMVKT